MKRILITGSTGFVGANLTRRLLEDGHEVHVMVRLGYTKWRIESIRADISVHEVDLTDKEAVSSVVDTIQPDWVFHLAAFGAYSWQSDLNRMVEANIQGTINLVEACLKTDFEAFVNTGSSSEYGFKDHAPTELDFLEPNSHYAVTKVCSTTFCRYTAQSMDVHLPTLRLYSVYGPYEDPARLLPSVILRGLEGRFPPLVGPDVARDYVFTEDVNEAFLLAASTPGQEPGAVYNVGTGVQTSMRELVAAAQRILDINVEPAWGTMPSRPWDTHVWLADRRKAQDALGWRPRHTFEQGFRQMLDWFRQNPALLALYREHCEPI